MTVNIQSPTFLTDQVHRDQRSCPRLLQHGDGGHLVQGLLHPLQAVRQRVVPHVGRLLLCQYLHDVGKGGLKKNKEKVWNFPHRLCAGGVSGEVHRSLSTTPVQAGPHLVLTKCLTSSNFRTISQTMSNAKRLLVYIVPVTFISFALNIPKVKIDSDISASDTCV